MIQKNILSGTLGIAAILITVNAMAADEKGIQGQWYSEDNVSKIHIYEHNGLYSGKIIWLEDPLYEKGDKEAGKIKRDRENPEKKLRKTPIIGLKILKNFKFDKKDKEWTGGTIYDPDKGKLYKCVIKFEKDSKVEGGTKLYVRGYVGIPALGRTTYWTRVPEKDLEKLDE
ncbi:MAG: hypothetical protein COA73_06350 [Candidatus Hydrogenedentota bacterium]|nr:MAG: hypothetical protein COA73_06350 [Candidatus Hydrogenedentota bacterium]